MATVNPQDIRRKDLELHKNGGVGLYAIVHAPTETFMIVGTRDECIEFSRRYE